MGGDGGCLASEVGRGVVFAAVAPLASVCCSCFSCFAIRLGFGCFGGCNAVLVLYGGQLLG